MNENKFKENILEFSKKSLNIKNACFNEEATKMYLILPFLEILGYDTRNPNEITPEYSADFKDKQKARVDYVILSQGKPIIAIECKTMEEDLSNHSGQLRAYFTPLNIKVAILTNGIIWKFYADSDKENIMDEKPFLNINLEEIAGNKIKESDIETLNNIHKINFNESNIGSEAKKKLMFNSFLAQITNLSNSPTNDFSTLLLRNAGVNVVNSKRLEENIPLIKSAFHQFIENQIMDRLNIKKVEEKSIEIEVPVVIENKIETTNTEIKAYELTKSRLIFLLKDEIKYESILKNIQYRDYKTKFIVYYNKEQKGKIFELCEKSTGLEFSFVPEKESDPWQIINIKNIDTEFNKLDEILLKSFEKVYNIFKN